MPFRLSPLVLADGFAWGWALGRGAGPVAVHLYADGRRVATELTGITLPAAVLRGCGRPPAGAAGFAFALPARLLDGLPHDIHVALPSAESGGLHGAVLAWRSGPVGGTVRQQGRQFVGTVWFARPPARPARLQVSDAQGRRLYSLRLQPAATPDAQGYPAAFAVPADALPETARRGPLHFACGHQALQGSPCVQAQTLVGLLDDVAVGGRITGWALDATDLLNPLELVLRVDGQAVSWFRPNVRRTDISKYLGLPDEGLGLAGFDVPAPPVLADGQRHAVEVVSAADGQPLKNGRQQVQLPRAGLPLDAAGPPALPPVRRAWPQPTVSVVILNRNGHDVLQAFLHSWARHNTTEPAELIVVDHASTDASLALLRQWRGRLDLQVLALDHNGSFSASSNLGASRARGQYLLFMNNDIVWLQDALPRLLESLHDPQVGVVGIKLLKVVGESRAGARFASEVQHLGVRFKLNQQGYWPYEAEPSALHGESEHAPQCVPAVTGAVLLCRKTDFDAVGGFDAAYFYGFEDVELCLRLAYRLRKTVVCRNDCVALHHHGHTRLSGREMSIYDRVQRNSAVLESHIGVWVKQAYWRSLVTGDGYITREPLTIGIVLDSPERNTPLWHDALALAAQLRTALPHAQLRLLPPERDWKNAAGLHVLLVADLRYDIRALHHARADVLTVAWLRGPPARWPRLAWWDEFGAVLAPARGPAAGDALVQLLGPQRWRLRVLVQVPGDGQAPPAGLADAQRLQKHLRAQGLPCWVRVVGVDDKPAPMADVCLTIGPVAAQPENGLLQLAWPGGAAPLPGAAWLAEQMEKRVGNTFRSP
ncbi:MAG: glycosyltransferase family 2 protein [Ramlibacter sp.]